MKTTHGKSALLGAFLAFLLQSGCSYDTRTEDPGPELSDTARLSYREDIKIIVEQNCAVAGCHVPGTGLPDYTTHQGLLQKVIPGKPGESRVVIRMESPTNPMPPAFAPDSVNLTDSARSLIKTWIRQGAPF